MYHIAILAFRTKKHFGDKSVCACQNKVWRYCTKETTLSRVLNSNEYDVTSAEPSKDTVASRPNKNTEIADDTSIDSRML